MDPDLAIDETTNLNHFEEEKTTGNLVERQDYFGVFPKMHETINKINLNLCQNNADSMIKNNSWSSIKDTIVEIRNTCNRVNLIDCLSQVEENLVSKSTLDINNKKMQQVLYVGIFFRFTVTTFLGMINSSSKQKKYKMLEEE